MDHEHPKFKTLESHLNFIVEQLNQDILFLRESDLETQKLYEPKIENVIRRICLEPAFRDSDISFLHEDFQLGIRDYEYDLEKDFSETELKELSKELLSQIQPDEFGL